MKNRNPGKPQRQTEANERRTRKVIERYQGKNDLLRTWEQAPDEIQIKFHDDILKLRATVRMLRNLLLHRADPNAKV